MYCGALVGVGGVYHGHEVAYYESKVTTKCPEILANAMIASQVQNELNSR